MSVARTLDPERLQTELRRGAEELCRSHADLLSRADRDRLVDEMLYETLGLGPLEPLLADETVTDILINGPTNVYVERRGCLERTDVNFRDHDHLLSIVQRIAGRVGRRVDESSPMVDARLADGSRINAVIRPLALDGALVSIRRFAAQSLTTEDLIQSRSAGCEMLAFLAACVRAKTNILISGGTGSGKTTLLNILSGYIGQNERIITIEDAAELRLQQPHVGRMEIRPMNLEGRGEITARDLLRNALRMRPDRIIVGECRGQEAYDMLQAMNTGHEGGLTTIHANDARHALNRLTMLIATAVPELPLRFVQSQIAETIELVVQTSRLSDGKRKVTQISEVVGVEGERIDMHDLFVFRQTGVDDNGDVRGEFAPTGRIPKCLDRLKRRNLELPAILFDPQRRDVGVTRTTHAGVAR
ncbi:MAG: CpaF family protein [Pirellulales bacterium]